MKLSRRCFLSFLIGGAAGTALSPLPWKLTDDLSIWSQNWPWTPVPPDGAATVVNSTCTLCPGGCGISVRKIDERAVKIEGLAGHPVNNGGICLLGLSGLQLLYGPTRIQAPLKRVGARGQGHWKTITWEAAVAEVAEQLKGIRSQGDPQSLACIAGRREGTVARLLQRLMDTYGSPNYFPADSVEDAYRAALKATLGTDGRIGMDVEHADFILSFGCAILEGYGSPVRMIRANSGLRERQGTLVQIEPRLSNTAARADLWLAARPGSEADLALAMAAVIIEQKRFNADFINTHVEGFDAFARLVRENCTPEKAAAATGIAARTIADTALRFAAAAKPLAICGRGRGDIPGALREALAVQALNALVGGIGREGGALAMGAYDYIEWPAATSDELAAARLKAGTAADGHNRVHQFIQAVNATPGRCKALLVAEANPRYSLEGGEAVKTAFDKIPFIVSFASFMDESAANADLILPNHVYLERYEDFPVTAGMTPSVVGLCRPVVEPLYHTQHLGDTIIQIARALKSPVAEAFPWKNYKACLQESVGGRWEELQKKGFWVQAEAVAQRTEETFRTASGKYLMMDDKLGPIYLAEAVAPEGDEKSYPLLLVPYDSMRLAAGDVGDPPFMIKTVSDDVLKGRELFVEVNPETAAKSGLSDGQSAVLSTPRGQAAVRVNASEGVMPGVIAMPRGLGHSAYDQYLADKGVNVNMLIGPAADPATGLNAAWGIRAKLAKA